MELRIYTKKHFNEALEKGLFAKATCVMLRNLPNVTVLPDMPCAREVILWNLPKVTVIPDMPNAKEVWLDGKRIK